VVAAAALPASVVVGASPAHASDATVCASGCSATTIAGALAVANAGDTITVLDAVHTEAGITVSKDVTIEGLGASATSVEAAASADSATDRVFTIANGVTATIQDLTIANGHAPTATLPDSDGGGVLNRGTLTLQRVRVTANRAGSAPDKSSDQSFALPGGNGGGLANLGGQLTVLASTIDANRAGDGGALLSCDASFVQCSSGAGGDGGGIGNDQFGMVTMQNVTVSGNASGDAGPVACVDRCLENVGGVGGGLFAVVDTTTLNNVTITANMGASGAAIYVTGQPGGSDTTTVVHVANSIVGGNTGANECHASFGLGIVSGGHNVMASGCPAGGTGDQTVASGDVATTVLFPLGDNGGPTPTHALRSGSPAIDAGSPETPGSSSTACEPTDQRGYLRPAGAACDAGAVELGAVAPQAPTITGTPPTGGVGEPYSFAFSTTGAPTPIVIASTGTVPPGLTVTSDGHLTGTPTKAGTFHFTVQAANGIDPPGTDPVTVTIHTKPALRIGDATTTEGQSGTHPLTFHVTLSRASTIPVSVKWVTADGSARAPSDYVAGAGTLTFAPGQTTKPIAVQIRGDRIKEPNEVFFVLLHNPVGATIADPNATGGILNDD
jgi:hypothetical protein